MATSPRLTSQALAFDVVGRNAILRDPDYQDGQYYANGTGPSVGLAMARMLGHITYLSREAMTQKFDAHRLQPRDVHTQFETKFSVGSYLAYQGDKFVERFDANSYLTLTHGHGPVRPGRHAARSWPRRSRPSPCRWLLVSFTSDWLFPPFQSQEMVDALIAAEQAGELLQRAEPTAATTPSCCPTTLAIYGELMRAFLANLRRPADAVGGRRGADVAGDDAGGHGPTSIFHHRRLDYDSILELIPPGASVLDLGCGTGGLLARLQQRGHRRIMGVENDEQAILACVRRGLDVVQADLNQGLPAFADGQFDCVVLSQTLQAVLDVQRVLADMLRVGRRGIVSFPNFAYRKLREQWPQRAAPRGPARCWATRGTTRPTCASSPSPTSRSSAGRTTSASTRWSPWTPRPTARSATIPT